MKLTNEEKCVYCREYGNLPCDECNKKLEAKKAMSKRLEELYEKMVDEAPFVFPESNRKYVYELAEIYAREVAQASLERASEKTTAQQPVVMRNVLADLRNQLERSRQLTQSFDDGEARWRDGMENGLETAIELLEYPLTKHFA